MRKKASTPALDPSTPNISPEWKARLSVMRKYQDESAADWAGNEKLLDGDSTGIVVEGLPAGAGKKASGFCYAHGLVGGLLSQIYVQNPTAIAEPYNQDLYETGRLITRIIQTDMEVMGVEATIQQVVRDCFPYGYGAVIEAGENFVSQHHDEEKGLDVPVLDGQQFSLRRIHPHDILFDPAGRLPDLSDHRYCAVRFYPTIGWLREHAKEKGWKLPPNLNETPEAIPQLRGEPSMEVTVDSLGSAIYPEKDPDYRQVSVWEIHDKVKKEIVYVLQRGLWELGKNPWPVTFRFGTRDLFPITLLTFQKKSTGFYPRPELSFVRPQLVEIAELDRQMRRDAGQKIRKLATLAEFIDPTKAAEITDMSSENNVIGLDRKAVTEFFGDEDGPKEFDIRKVLMQLDDFRVDRDHMGRYSLLEAQIQHILGYGPSDRGGLPKVRSAREAMWIADSLEQKVHLHRGAVETMFREIAEKHIRFLETMQETTRYARNFPEVAESAPFLPYTKGQLKGEFAFRVFAGSSAPRNTDTRKAQTRDLFQLMAPVLGQQGMDLRPLVEMVGKAHGWDEVDRLFKNVRGELRALAAILFAVNRKQAPPQALMEAAARVVQVGLSGAELEQLKQQIGGAQTPATPGEVPPEKPSAPAGDVNPIGTQTGVF